MLQRILMPTDGSPESEKPLALVAQLAPAQGAEVTLLRVIEEPPFASTDSEFAMPPYMYEQMAAGLLQDAQNSLGNLQARLEADGVRASTVILKGPASAALLDYVERERPDLVAMATHGRTGLERFALGSVADRMVREGMAPVLVTRMSSEPTTSLERALVMLDGSGLAEAVLPLVETLAGRPIKQLTLFRAVLDPSDRSVAENYLQGVCARLASTGIPVEVTVEVGDPRPKVEVAAQATDVVILCTHGRGGIDRLRHGSVAEHVMREVKAPALLVRTETAPDPTR